MIDGNDDDDAPTHKRRSNEDWYIGIIALTGTTNSTGTSTIDNVIISGRGNDSCNKVGRREDPREICISASSPQRGQPIQRERARSTTSSSRDAGTTPATTMHPGPESQWLCHGGRRHRRHQHRRDDDALPVLGRASDGRNNDDRIDDGRKNNDDDRKEDDYLSEREVK